MNDKLFLGVSTAAVLAALTASEQAIDFPLEAARASADVQRICEKMNPGELLKTYWYGKNQITVECRTDDHFIVTLAEITGKEVRRFVTHGGWRQFRASNPDDSRYCTTDGRNVFAVQSEYACEAITDEMRKILNKAL